MKLTDFKLIRTDLHQEKLSCILEQFNRTASPYPGHLTVPQVFDQLLADCRFRPAVLQGAAQLSYQDLDRESNRLARFLLHLGIKPEEPVAVLLDTSPRAIVALLGILKAGGAYVPLNPEFPLERMKYILDDTGAAVAVSEKRYVRELNALQWESASLKRYVCVDSENVYGEIEQQGELMKSDLWNYVGETSRDDISGGGWVNSYTGENLSREVMDEYGDNVLGKLRPLLTKTDRVLEIGCSSGISLVRLAPLVGEYHGIDLSAEILKKTQQLVQEKGLGNVKLQCLEAHQIDQLEANAYDVVVINSVVQCFSGHNYLRNVLEKAIRLIGSKGFIFIGDIMDQEQKADLIDSLQAFKREHAGKGYKTKTDWSNELFLSRRYFEDLRFDFPVIEGITHSEKIGNATSELSGFRYDTVLKINQAAEHGVTGARTKQQYDGRHLRAFGTAPCAVAGSPDDLAYIMYTSGSTGSSKGVLVEHRAITRLVRATNYIGITPEDRVLSLSSYSFDGSTFDYFAPLLNGAKLILTSKDVLLDMDKLSALIAEQKITIFFITTAYFNLLVDKHPECFANVRKILFGGELVSVSHVARFMERYPGDALVHVYGPTENTTFSTFHPVARPTGQEHTIPIGRPIANSQCYILNEHNDVMPVGVVGELCVSGDGLARGYLNAPERTAEKFVAHPFVPSKKLYRTGDRAKWLPGGEIEFVGRVDDQVKIRGFRIEPGEVETAIRRLPGVQEAIVLVRKDAAGEKYLCAYVVLEEVSAEDLKAQLGQELPPYMVPAYFIPLEKLPLNTNGKVNKKQLPDPTEAYLHPDARYVEPTTKTEKKLAGIWADILGRGQIGVLDNFFEIGGHSLKATQVVSRVAQEFEVEMSIRDMFTHPTVKKLSEVILGKKAVKFRKIFPVAQQEYYELSHAQKRLWLLDQFQAVEEAYNVGAALLLEGDLNREAFEGALHTLVARHESLRTNFIRVNGGVMQKIHAPSDAAFRVKYVDISLAEDPKGEARSIAEAELSAPFALDREPLLRCKLLLLGETQFVVLLTMHHIISDGWSMQVLTNEFLILYKAYCEGKPSPLAPLHIQYKDYAAWQNRLLRDEAMQEHQAYWTNTFKKAPQPLVLPVDYPRPSVKTYNGSKVIFPIPREVSQWLADYGKQHNASLFMTLLASVNVLLYWQTRQEDIVVGSPIAGRNHNDLEDQIGFFVNTLPLRTAISPDENFPALLSRVRETTLAAYEHQAYPFDCLVDDLGHKTEISRSPLFDVMVMLQNAEVENKEAEEMKDVAVQGFEVALGSSQFDLSFSFSEVGDEIVASFSYNTDLFEKATVLLFKKHFLGILETIRQNPLCLVRELGMPATPTGRQVGKSSRKLLFDFS